MRISQMKKDSHPMLGGGNESPNNSTPQECTDNITLSPAFMQELERMGNAKRRSIESYRYAQQNDLGSSKKRERHSECASWFVIKSFYSVNVQKIDRSNFCRQRIICPACDLRRSLRLFADWVPKVQKLAESKPNLYFLTLTVKNRDSLSDAFAHLSKCFQTLRKSKGSNNPFRSVLGFVGQYEITYSNGLWHPHLHLIVELPRPVFFLDVRISPFVYKTPSGSSYVCRSSFQLDLITYWHTIAKDSFIVDFRPLLRASDGSFDIAKSISELLKYVAKPCDEKQELTPALMHQIASVLKGRRLLTSGGTFKDLTDTDQMYDDDLEGLDYSYLISHYIGSGSYSKPKPY